jgi:hypothetical protein
MYLDSLRTRGINVRITAPNASRLNGLVERRIRSIAESARAMCLTAGLPPSHFLIACEYSAQIQNHLPLEPITFDKTLSSSDKKQKRNNVTTNRTPCPTEIWHRKTFATWDNMFDRFRVFGCLAFALHRIPDKQVMKSEKAIFLGLAAHNPNTCMLMSLETKKYLRFFTTRDVVTHEQILPFQKGMHLPTWESLEDTTIQHGEIDKEPTEPAVAQPAAKPLTLGNDQLHAFESPEHHELEKPQPLNQQLEKRVIPTTTQVTKKRLSFSDATGSLTNLGETLQTNSEVEASVKPAATQVLATVPEEIDSILDRTQLGTGDRQPLAATSPAKLNIGSTYNTHEHGWCGEVYNDDWGKVKVHEINKDGDVQVTFPNHPECKPDDQYTISKEEIDGSSEHALIAEMLNYSHNASMFDYHFAESINGEFLTHEEFTISILPTEQAFNVSALPLPTERKTRKALKQTIAAIRSPPTQLTDLVGRVPADSVQVPRTHYQLKDSDIRHLVEDAQHAELTKLIAKNVFENAHDATTTPDDTIIPTMFVDRAKSDSNGMLASIKARLTTRGDLDRPPPGTTRKTYAAVLLPCTMLLLLSLHCADLQVSYKQMDLESAFVAAKTTRRIVVRLPPGYYGPGKRVPNAVHVLRYNLYGSDDAPLVYQRDLVAKHKALGFNTIREDHCYLEITVDGDFIKMVYHVDDFLIAHRGEKLWNWYITSLKEHYNFTVAPLHFYLGMRFIRDKLTGRFALDQEAQIDKMARAFGINSDKKVQTPIASFSEEDRPKVIDLPTSAEDKLEALKIPYRQAVGHLTYLAQCTHFEITLPTRIAASFVSEWGPKHWRWVKNIMRFLTSKASKTFYINGGPPTRRLTGWSDSDHAGNPDTRRSMAAHFVFYGVDIIDWYAKTETIVAHSSAESELMALDSCARAIQALRWLLSSLRHEQTEPSTINMDSSSAIGMAENPIQNRRNRHIHARYFYVRDLMELGTISLHKVLSENNLADLLATYKNATTFLHLLKQCKPQDA